jgi:hypothetical protein
MRVIDALINDNQRLISASYTHNAESIIPTYDDSWGDLYISRHSIGINGIVRAQTWHDAYEICEDEFFPEASETVEELVKEYGEDWSENPCFNEAYGFRPNGPNSNDKLKHGIYAKDLNGDYLDKLHWSLLRGIGITLTIAGSEIEIGD